MIDRPNMSELLRAMGETLSREVVPATEGSAQHSARVIANLCRILEREADLGADASRAAQADLARLLEHEGSLDELVAILDARLRGSDAPPDEGGEFTAGQSFESDAHTVLLADVKRRLAIDQPGYDE